MLVLGVGALAILSTKPGVATLLLVGALGTALALLVIEPTTTEAAFPETPGTARAATPHDTAAHGGSRR